MARNRTGNYSISGKACDIEYRVRRLEILTNKTRLALASIEPSAVGEDTISRGLELIKDLSSVIQQLAGSKPVKRAYGKAKDTGEKKKAPKPVKETPKAPKAPKAPKQEKASTGQLMSIDEALANMERIAAE